MLAWIMAPWSSLWVLFGPNPPIPSSPCGRKRRVWHAYDYHCGLASWDEKDNKKARENPEKACAIAFENYVFHSNCGGQPRIRVIFSGAQPLKRWPAYRSYRRLNRLRWILSVFRNRSRGFHYQVKKNLRNGIRMTLLFIILSGLTYILPQQF